VREEGNHIAALSVQRRLGLAGDFGDEVACGPLAEVGHIQAARTVFQLLYLSGNTRLAYTACAWQTGHEDAGAHVGMIGLQS
jgi:hypothetical protein